MSATYEALSETFPDRASESGRWAPIHGYEVHVVDLGCHYRWSLYHGRTATRGAWFIVGGPASSIERAWRAGCAALDIDRTQRASAA